MSRTNQFLVATATFSIALGIGFVMQNGDALAARFSETPTAAMIPAMAAPQATPVVMTTRPEPLPGTAAWIVRQKIDAGAAGMIANVRPHPTETLTLAAAEDEPVPDMTEMAAVAANAAPLALPLAQELPVPPMEPAPILQAAFETEPTAPVLPEAAEPQMQDPLADVAPAADCAVALTASAEPAAMVALSLAAPCAPGAIATIHHQGMMFTIATDASGNASVLVPALASSAVFMADLGADGGAVAVVTVADLGTYDRAVLQWQGEIGPEIHVREFGADYGQPGHVWHGAGGAIDTLLAGTGGYLLRLGDGAGLNPMTAEVYTYPSMASVNEGVVEFTVEAPVTEANCGADLTAQTIQVSPGAEPFSFDLTMSVPGCEAVGEYLVLKNMLLDLTLAAR